MPLPPADPLPLTAQEEAATDNLPGVPPTVLIGASLNFLESRPTGGVIQTRSAELTANFLTAVTVPTYVTLLTVPMTTLLASSYLDIRFSCGVRHIGASLLTVAITARLRVNGVLLTGGITMNTPRNQIQPMPVEKRLVVAAGLQTVVVEISKFAGAGQTIVIDVVTLPDLNGATLVVQENSS